MKIELSPLNIKKSLCWCALLAYLLAGGLTAYGQSPFKKLVDRSSEIPGVPGGYFNSFNPPAVDQLGNVVFRGRGSGPQNSAGVQGNYLTGLKNSSIERLADRNTIVPGSVTATFNAFPAVPRIDYGSVVFRGMSEPLAPGQEGNAGVYFARSGELSTAVNRTFTVPPDHSVYFGQFPGAPDVMTLKGRRVGNITTVLVTKGNWSADDEPESSSEEPPDHGGGGGMGGGGHEGESTGIYIRDLTHGGPVLRIADITTVIPGTSQTFGSTAPPSAADGKIVFVGYDNETSPTAGGLYLADAGGLTPDPILVPLAELGQPLPDGGQIVQISENVSFDGRTAAFHVLTSDATEAILAVDVSNPASLSLIADTTTPVPGQNDVFSTFLFPNMQGNLTSFVAVDGDTVVFQGAGSAGLTGIYAALDNDLRKVIDTTDDGGLLDPEMIGVPITELGIERDAINNGDLVFVATIGDEETDFQRGIYTTSLTRLGGGVFAGQTGDLLQIVGDPFSNGVSVQGVHVFGSQFVIVTPSLRNLGLVTGSGLYMGVERLHIDLRDGDDTLRVKGTFKLQEFVASGGPGFDVREEFSTDIEAPVVEFTDFESVLPLPKPH